MPTEPRSFEKIPIGSAQWLREGSDGVILAVGRMVKTALQAAEQLVQKGLDIAVINARFIKPLDEALLMQLADRYPRWITVEDNVIHGGFGSAVLEFLADYATPGTQIMRLGLPDYFVPHGHESQLFRDLGLDVDGLMLAARDMFRDTKKTIPVNFLNSMTLHDSHNPAWSNKSTGK